MKVLIIIFTLLPIYLTQPLFHCESVRDFATDDLLKTHLLSTHARFESIEVSNLPILPIIGLLQRDSRYELLQHITVYDRSSAERSIERSHERDKRGGRTSQSKTAEKSH